MITLYVLLDDWYALFGEPVKCSPKLQPSEIILVAVIAAKYFHNNHERAADSRTQDRSLVVVLMYGWSIGIGITPFISRSPTDANCFPRYLLCHL